MEPAEASRVDRRVESGPTEAVLALQRFGFSKPEALVYVALVEGGPADQRQLLPRTHISHRKLSPALNRLLAQGAVEKDSSRPTVFRAVSPMTVFAQALSARELVEGLTPVFARTHRAPPTFQGFADTASTTEGRGPQETSPAPGRARKRKTAEAGGGRERRTSFDVTSDILQVVRSGARRTHIMYQANLSFEQLNRYLAQLVGAGLIEVDSSSRLYVVTTRGVEFLRQYEEQQRAEQQSETNRAVLLRMLACSETAR